jgi:hypothetical protein
MKHTTLISALIIFLVDFSTETYGQTSDYYNILLRKVFQNSEIQYDTVVPINFLSDTTAQGIFNMQFFEGFNYPILEYKKSMYRVSLTNDTVEINISVTPFDLKNFSNHYLSDSSLYFKNIYYRSIPFDIFQNNPYYPKTVVSDITIKIKRKKVHLPEKEFNRIYNPVLESWTYNNSELHGVNAYIAHNKKILLTLSCGEGAGSSIAIFIIRTDGTIESKILEPDI